MVPLNGLRAALSSQFVYLKTPLLELFGARTLFLGAVSLSLLAGWLAWKRQRWVSKAAAVGLAMLFPFCVLTFSQALWRALPDRGQPFGNPPLAARLADARTTPRVVWIIFDEWDYRLTFLDRPKALAMPAIDRMRSESLSADHASSPTMGHGHISARLPHRTPGTTCE